MKKIVSAVGRAYVEDFVDVITDMGYCASDITHSSWCIWVTVVKWEAVRDSAGCRNRAELDQDDVDIIQLVKEELKALSFD